MGRGPGLNDRFPNLVGRTQNSTNFDLYEYLGESWGILLLHPGDFTPVCTTELGEAAELQFEFKNRGVKLCGFSCNDAASHRRWIRDIEYVQGTRVEFPLFCDPDREYATQLGVLDDSNRDQGSGLPLTVRGTFVLKPDKTIAMVMMYPHTSGRNLDELIRVLDSLLLTDKHSVATPVNWKPGEDVIVDHNLSDAKAKERHGENGVRILQLPSEREEKSVDRHYLRYTGDPSKSEE